MSDDLPGVNPVKQNTVGRFARLLKVIETDLTGFPSFRGFNVHLTFKHSMFVSMRILQIQSLRWLVYLVVFAVVLPIIGPSVIASYEVTVDSNRYEPEVHLGYEPTNDLIISNRTSSSSFLGLSQPEQKYVMHASMWGSEISRTRVFKHRGQHFEQRNKLRDFPETFGGFHLSSKFGVR